VSLVADTELRRSGGGAVVCVAKAGVGVFCVAMHD